jgi:small subunit ribosomal protein S9
MEAKTTHKSTASKKEYVEAMGKRKTGSARVRIIPGSKGEITVNDKSLHVYFPTEELQTIVKSPLVVADISPFPSISVHIVGGGIHSQAEAVRHGIARALLRNDATLRIPLKQAGLLTRDERIKERRKFGLKKARRAPQWSKR